MPELPDIETFKRYLDATALNRKIARVTVKNRKILRRISPQALAKSLTGRTIRSSRRHGKFLFAELDRNGSAVFHFGMTGFLAYFENTAEEPEHTRVRIDFTNGSFLGYVCPRMFGEMDHTRNVDQYIKERRLGPDALASTRDVFKALLADKKGAVKSALMNQELLAGIGNVYSDEILFQARLHPEAPVDQLGEKSLDKIHTAMKHVLEEAIRRGADPRRLPESWLLPNRRQGGPCPRCGEELLRIPVNRRSGYFCPSCQTLRR